MSRKPWENRTSVVSSSSSSSFVPAKETGASSSVPSVTRASTTPTAPLRKGIDDETMASRESTTPLYRSPQQQFTSGPSTPFSYGNNSPLYGNASSLYSSPYGGGLGGGGYGGLGGLGGVSPFANPYSSPYSGSAAGLYGNPYSSPYGAGPYGPGGPTMFGGVGGGAPPLPPPRSTLDTIQHGIMSVGTLTEGFAHLSNILNASWQTLHMSFLSLARLSEGLTQFRDGLYTLLRAVTFAKLVHTISSGGGGDDVGAVGRTAVAGSASFGVNDFLERERRRRWNRWLAVVACVSVLFGPQVWRAVATWIRRRRTLRTRRLSRDSDDADNAGLPDDAFSLTSDDQGSDDHVEDNELRERELVNATRQCVAKHNYRANRDDELSFQRGDLFRLVRPARGDWWDVVDRQGRQGLVPNNFVKAIASKNRRRQPPPSSLSMPEQQQHQQFQQRATGPILSPGQRQVHFNSTHQYFDDDFEDALQ